MKFKNSNNGPCAACKSQRRRCSTDCQLAPFFPSDQPKRFEEARKLFGVRNIIKNLKRVGDDPFIRSETMWALTYESSLRAQDKVCGATGEIIKLCSEIQKVQQEIELVRAQTAMSKACCESGLLDSKNYYRPIESDGGVMMDRFDSFVGDELKVFWANQVCDDEVEMYLANNDHEEEMVTESNQPSFEFPLKSELEHISEQNIDIENELKNAAAFFTFTSNVKTEEEIFPLSVDF